MVLLARSLGVTFSMPFLVSTKNDGGQYLDLLAKTTLDLTLKIRHVFLPNAVLKLN
jgi:hypothetical protein